MAKKQIALSDELKFAIEEAARAGALEAYKTNSGLYVNYFKAMESILYNYKKLAALVADGEAYCEVEYHAGKAFASGSSQSGYYQHRTEADIIDELREEKQKQFRKTKFGFESLSKAIRLFEGQREFVVIRLYYFGEDINGNPREGGKAATWEEVAYELEEAGILKEIKTARRWRNKIVNDMAVCIFGIPAAVSAGTHRTTVIAK